MAFNFGELLGGIGKFAGTAGQAFGDVLQQQGGLPSTAQRQESEMGKLLAIMKGDFADEFKQDAARKIMQRFSPELVAKMDKAGQSFTADQTAAKQQQRIENISELTLASQRLFDVGAEDASKSVNVILQNLLTGDQPAPGTTGTVLEASAPAIKSRFLGGKVDATTGPTPGPDGIARTAIAPEETGIIGKGLGLAKKAGGVAKDIIGTVVSDFGGQGGIGTPPRPDNRSKLSAGRNFTDSLPLPEGTDLSKTVHRGGKAPTDVQNFFKAASAISPGDTTPKSFEQQGITDKSAQQQLQELEKSVPNIREIAASDPENMKIVLRWLKTGKDDQGNPFTRKDFIDFISGKK